MEELKNAISPTGRVIVYVERLMEEYGRREDGSVSTIKQDVRFDNHSKMTTSGIVVVGTNYGGYEVFSDADMIMPRSKHKPLKPLFSSIFTPSINKGDRAFFHYLCGENKAFIKADASGGFYINMNSSDVFCTLPGDDKSKPLLWNQNYCAGTEIIEDERNTKIFDVYGNEMRAKMKPSKGVELVVGLTAKPMVNECIMWGMGAAQHQSVHEEVKEGDHVYLSTDSEFKNFILDKPVWVFKHTDIVGHVKKQPGDTIPVGMYHLVKIALGDYRQETGKTIVRDELTGYNATLLHKKPVIITPNTGKIIRSGKKTSRFNLDDKVLFTKRWCRMLDKGHWLIHDSEIQMRIS